VNKKVSLKQQLQSANTGDVIVTDQNRTGVYVAAKRAGVTVSTKELPDKRTEITVTAKIVKPPEPKLTQFESVLQVVSDWTTETRLKLFEQFELCCAMKRGNCICPTEVVEIKPLQSAVISTTGDSVADFIAKAQAKKGIVSQPFVTEPEPDEEEWRFTSDKPQYETPYDVYRKQFLVSNPKRTRTVKVDEDNQDEIIGYK
jgi:hypothetical protein